MNSLNVLRRTTLLKNLLKNKNLNNIERTFYQKTLSPPAPYLSKKIIIDTLKSPFLLCLTISVLYYTAKNKFQFGLVDIEGIQKMINKDLKKMDN